MPRTRLARFKSCYTCRTRKVKCDEQRPTCARCRRAGLECKGYQPDLQYVDETPSFSPSHDLPHVFSRSNTTTRQPWQAVMEPRTVLNLSGWEDEICVAFSINNLIAAPGTPGPGLELMPWPGFGAIQSQQSLAYKSLCAFSKVFFARKNGDRSTMVRGLRLYGAALRKLGTLLESQEAARSDDALLSSMILSLYELMMDSVGTGWMAHGKGFGKLIELRGPAAYDNEHNRHLLEYNRFMIILASLATGQSTFLSSPDWKTRPWTSCKLPPDSMHKLVDIYTDLPGLKHDAQFLRYHAMPGELASFFSDAFSIVDRLKAWREEWDLLPKNRPVTVENTGKLGNAQNPLHISFHYSSFRVAHTVSLYDAAILQTIELIMVTYSTLNGPPQDHEYLLHGYSPDDLLTLAKDAAIEICRGLEFQINNDFGVIYQLFVLFPMRMAWKALGRGTSPEGQWLEQQLLRLSSPKGWAVARRTMLYSDYTNDTHELCMSEKVTTMDVPAADETRPRSTTMVS